MPHTESAAIQVLSRHIRQLISLTDDPDAVRLLVDCADRLSDRAYQLAVGHTPPWASPKPESNHPQRK